jgi:hypothetical protein
MAPLMHVRADRSWSVVIPTVPDEACWANRVAGEGLVDEGPSAEPGAPLPLVAGASELLPLFPGDCKSPVSPLKRAAPTAWA